MGHEPGGSQPKLVRAVVVGEELETLAGHERKKVLGQSAAEFVAEVVIGDRRLQRAEVFHDAQQEMIEPRIIDVRRVPDAGASAKLGKGGAARVRKAKE